MKWDTNSLLAVGSEDHLASGEPRAVMLVFVDNAGVARMKSVPAERLERAATRGVGISVALGALTATDAVAAVPGFDAPVGDMRLVADLNDSLEITAAKEKQWSTGNSGARACVSRP